MNTQWTRFIQRCIGNWFPASLLSMIIASACYVYFERCKMIMKLVSTLPDQLFLKITHSSVCFASEVHLKKFEPVLHSIKTNIRYCLAEVTT